MTKVLPRQLNDRVVLARALRPAGFPVVAGLSAALVIGACIPAGIALTLGAIVSALDRHHGQDLFSAVLLPPCSAWSSSPVTWPMRSSCRLSFKLGPVSKARTGLGYCG